ncbi:MAG: hypothetical protein CL554_08080 [Algoriphagus sp.]|jgi:hypothetical protein|uniref:hypothetical protein n=1 Tax=Algoriphagus sp. TaxID=1872435 RepID=UPI000C5C5AC6|nr:hypothetical protein [Algoriphagus sp.]MAL13374.1 hypothetical protein [Algoriphagus sp.]HAS58507.1 hypothetical protein [Algoriphagus sp.]|tara:strand:+ start:7081 stop:8463 length:1383 start_codon:yes stop_codon:yes gene_type:complete
MKKQTFHNVAKAMSYMVLVAICAFSAFAAIPGSAEALIALVGNEGGVGTVMAATTTTLAVNTRETVDGARPRSATDPGHIQDDVSRFVTMIKPDDFTLDTLLRDMESSEKATDLIVNFEEVEFRGREDVTTAALAAPTGTTDADKFRDLAVGNSDLWVKGETVYIPGVLISGKPLQLRVEKVNSNNTIQVTGINTADNVVPAIADATTIYRGATSYGELRAKAENKTLIPGNRFNYCQRHLAQVEEGYIRSMLETKSGFNIQDQNFIRMYDFRTEMEWASIFGTKNKTWSKEENEFVYTQEGVYHQLTKQLDWTAAAGITNNTWIDWTKQIFADNSGAEDRVALVGKELMATILKIDSVQKQQSEERVELVPGMKIMRVETSFGILYLKHHKLFDTVGHANDGMVVDMTNIKRRPFLALNQRKLGLREAGISNVNATLIEEIFCLETRYLDAHARIVKTA